MQIHSPNFNFLDLEPEFTGRKDSRVLILPLPYEQTSSYKAGSKEAPAKIISASHQVETWDEELGCEPCDIGIHTLEAFEPHGSQPIEMIAAIRAHAAELLKEDKFLVSLGGEHSITYPLVDAAKAKFGDITLLQFDAHADLRDSYDGSPYSHASVMRRVADDLGLNIVQVGIRSLCKEESEYIRSKKDWPVYWAHDLRKNIPLEDIVLRCSDKVYITVDMDAFDSGVLPALGTPEPGGLGWYDVLDIAKAVCEKREIVAMDFSELCPQPNLHASDFFTAKLIYKLIGYACCLK